MTTFISDFRTTISDLRQEYSNFSKTQIEITSKNIEIIVEKFEQTKKVQKEKSEAEYKEISNEYQSQIKKIESSSEQKISEKNILIENLDRQIDELNVNASSSEKITQKELMESKNKLEVTYKAKENLINKNEELSSKMMKIRLELETTKDINKQINREHQEIKQNNE